MNGKLRCSSFEKSLDFFEKAVSCRKEMYNLAENKKAPKRFIYNKIIVEWFNLEVNRYWIVKDFPKKRTLFKRECEELAKITFQMVKTLYGNDSKLTREWKEKSENFENWFKNEF